MMVLAVLACGLGLSASALEHPGGFFLADPERLAATPMTRLVYSGPMPALEAAVPEVEKPASVRLPVARQDRLPPLWLEPAIQPRPVSLPSIPHFELISEAKVATIKGRPITADPLFNSAEQEEEPGGRLMTKMPMPAAPASGAALTFCQGFC